MQRDTASTREALIRRGVGLGVATVVWNDIEGVIAVAAGMLASSVALIGFGIDSFVETTGGAVVGWRLHAELVGQLDKERAELVKRRACRIAGALLLGFYALRHATQPNTSMHLTCLAECGLVTRDRRGKFVDYEIADKRVVKFLDQADELLLHVGGLIAACLGYQRAGAPAPQRRRVAERGRR